MSPPPPAAAEPADPLRREEFAALRRVLHTSPKSIRKRLLSYFSECIKRTGSYEFDIPYNRQQLADYLNVERSALSNELSLMQRDGLIRYEKNHFAVTEQLGQR